MQQALRQGSVLCFNYEQKKASITRIVQWILARMYTSYVRAWKKWHDATLLHRTQLMLGELQALEWRPNHDLVPSLHASDVAARS